MHVPLQGRQKDLRGVAEHDNPNGDGELLDIDVKFDLVPGPVSRPGEAVRNHQDVDDEVGHRAQQAELGDGFQVLEEGAGEESGGGDDGPRLLGNWHAGEAVVHEITTDHHVKDAGHHQLDDLGYIHDVTAQRRESGRAAGVGNVHVWVPHTDELPVFILLVQAGNEDFASVAADHSGENNEKESKVSSMQDGVGQTQNEHPL